MSILDGIAKIGSILKAPFDALGELIKEPSRRWEHQRNEMSTEYEHRREKELRELDVQLTIKRQTGIQKAIFELDEIRKEKDFERMERTIKALQEHQESWARLNTETIKAIGNMQIELYDKAQDLVLRKTQQFRELQDQAYRQAEQEILRIEGNFSENETAKTILYRAVDLKLSNVVLAADNFLKELNRDIILLNNDISSLSKQGQVFIENNLNRLAIANGYENATKVTEVLLEKEINPINQDIN